MDDKTLLNQLLEDLVGKKCWAFYAGPSTGSAVILDFGDKIPRKRKLSNPNLTSDERNYAGEYVVGIHDAAWRLSCNKDVIATHRDNNSVGQRMLQGLEQLIGLEVTSVAISKMSSDLMMFYENGYRLEIFCDSLSHGDIENYSLSSKEIIFSFESGYQPDGSAKIVCNSSARTSLELDSQSSSG